MTKRTELQTTLVTGSLLDTMQKKGISKAQAIMDIEVVVICDGSMSMVGWRYERLCEVLRNIQGEHPGKVAVVSYSGSGEHELCEDGIPILYQGMTDMVGALKYVKEWDSMPDITFFFLSDGEPTCDRQETLNYAKTFQNPINTIFIGDDSNTRAIHFMELLGKNGGGEHTDDFTQKLLHAKVNRLLLGSGH